MGGSSRPKVGVPACLVPGGSPHQVGFRVILCVSLGGAFTSSETVVGEGECRFCEGEEGLFVKWGWEKEREGRRRPESVPMEWRLIHT